MKKLVILILCMMLCLSAVSPAFAAEDDFVPSITYKGAPDMTVSKDPQGNDVLGAITDADGKVQSYVKPNELILTSLAKADALPAEEAKLMKDLHKQIVDGTMKLPYENNKDMVVMELFEISFSDAAKEEQLKPEGVVVTTTLELGVAAGVEVSVMTYKENAWNPIKKVTNNGDGTVTCVFEYFCPVAISVAAEDLPSVTGDESEIMLWGVVMALSAAGLAVVTVLYFRNRRRSV